MNTIKMTMVCVALVCGGMVMADEVTTPTAPVPQVQPTDPVTAAKAKAAAEAVQAVEAKVEKALAPAPAPVPQRTWGQWGHGLASTTVKGVAYAGAQMGNAAMTCDSAALYPFGYLSDASWSAACSADAYAESIRF